MNTITSTKKSNTSRFPQQWAKNDEGCSKFYTYILKLQKGDLYIGHTRELQARLLEHKEDLTHSTAGEHPKLRYFEILPTREAARNRELELQHLLKNNRRELIRLMSEFRSLVAQIEFN